MITRAGRSLSTVSSVRPKIDAPVRFGGSGITIALVTDVRTVGRASLVRLCMQGSGGREWHLEARLSGRDLPDVGSRVAVSVAAWQAFVFAHEKG